MKIFLPGPLPVLALLVAFTCACSSLTEKVILEGAVAQVDGSRIHIAATTPLQGEPGRGVTIYQRVEQAAVDPTSKPWHLLKPVATGTITEVTLQGAWVTIESGVVEPHGEIQLRQGR